VGVLGNESAQKWLLKRELKLADQTEALGKNSLEMFDGLQERIGLGTVRRFLPAAQSTTKRVEPLAQPLQQVINRFQGKRQAQRLGGGFDTGIGHKLDQKLAQQRSADGVARQHVSQKNRKRLSATAAPAAIGTKDPLAPSQQAAIVLGGIVAIKNAVPV
jgi:hypothetical protein